jgi:hypothetical protein
MEGQSKLAALIDLAEQVGITIRRVPSAGESAEHPGGALVRLKGKEVIFLDPTAPLGDQIAVVASALRGRSEVEGRFLPPEIRQAIEEG